ncbi:MAG: hypothetical protein QXN55_02065 [Candidatus Nitrosotenuis sp.]
MGIFGRKKTEEERIEENLRLDAGSKGGDLICEEAIMQDKARFGRVRKSLMAYLREQYGQDVADRALWRINRRKTDGSLDYKKPKTPHKLF